MSEVDNEEAQALNAGDTAAAFETETIHNPVNGSNTTRTIDSPKAITIRDTQATSFLDPNLYIQMKALAQDFIASKAIPGCWQSAQQVLVGLQTGLEMGMKPMEAMNSLYVVNGAVNVWGKATTRRLTEHGYSIKYSGESQLSCTATVRKGDVEYIETYTFAEAVESGYTKDNYGKEKIGWRPGINRRKKLRYGALALIISSYIPEVLGSAVGIAEISEDVELNQNASKAIEVTKEKIMAAQAKRKQLESKKFTPNPVQTAIEVSAA